MKRNSGYVCTRMFCVECMRRQHRSLPQPTQNNCPDKAGNVPWRCGELQPHQNRTNVFRGEVLENRDTRSLKLVRVNPFSTAVPFGDKLLRI